MTIIVDWTGESGTKYRYWAMRDPKDANTILPVSGNYAFVKQLPNGNFTPLYFGETDDVQDRIPSHEIWDEALRLGATHVMSHTTPAGEYARLAEEADLIARYNPPLNVQHRTAR